MGGELTGMTFREEVCRMRAVRHREAVGVLEVLRTGLDGALGSLGCYEMWRLVALPVAGGLELNDPCGPFQDRKSVV